MNLFAYGTTFAILTITTFVLVILTIVGSVFSDGVTNYLSRNHIYDAIIMTALLEILYISFPKRPHVLPFQSYATEQKALVPFLEALKESKPDSVDFFSAGLSSRYQLIQELIDDQIPVRVLVQDQRQGVDKVDAERLKEMLQLIVQSVPEKAEKFLEIRALNRVATLRAVIANRRQSAYIEALFSWYTYDSHGTLIGHSNPSIYIRPVPSEGQLIAEYLRRKFDMIWGECKSNRIYPPDANSEREHSPVAVTSA